MRRTIEHVQVAHRLARVQRVGQAQAAALLRKRPQRCEFPALSPETLACITLCAQHRFAGRHALLCWSGGAACKAAERLSTISTRVLLATLSCQIHGPHDTWVAQELRSCPLRSGASKFIRAGWLTRTWRKTPRRPSTTMNMPASLLSPARNSVSCGCTFTYTPMPHEHMANTPKQRLRSCRAQPQSHTLCKLAWPNGQCAG